VWRYFILTDLRILHEVELDLERLGHDVVTSTSVSTAHSFSHRRIGIRTLGDSAKVFEPKLVQYDQWGRRVDDLQTSEGWRELKALSQREGLPAIFYERKQKEYSRVYGFAKAHLMVGDTHTVRRRTDFALCRLNVPLRFSAQSA